MQVLSITNWVLATRLITLRLGRHQIRSASVVEATRLCKGAGYGVAVVKSVRFQFPRDLLRHGLTKIRPWRMLAFHKSRVMQCRSIIWKDSRLSRRNEEMHEHTTFIIESNTVLSQCFTESSCIHCIPWNREALDALARPKHNTSPGPWHGESSQLVGSSHIFPEIARGRSRFSGRKKRYNML